MRDRYFDEDSVFRQYRDDCGRSVRLSCVVFEYLSYNFNDVSDLRTNLPVGPQGQVKQPDLRISSPGPLGARTVAIEVTSVNGSVSSSCSAVARANTFELCGSWGITTEVVLTSDELPSRITFHSSCSQSIALGDVYGSLRIVRLSNSFGWSSSVQESHQSEPATLTINFAEANISALNRDIWKISLLTWLFSPAHRERKTVLQDPTALVLLTTHDSGMILTLRSSEIRDALRLRILRAGGICLDVAGHNYCGTVERVSGTASTRPTSHDHSEGSPTSNVRYDVNVHESPLVLFIATLLTVVACGLILVLYNVERRQRAKVNMEVPKTIAPIEFDLSWDESSVITSETVESPQYDSYMALEKPVPYNSSAQLVL